MALKEWNEYIGHFTSEVLNDKSIPADHASKKQLKQTLSAHASITAGLTEFDKAVADFKTTTDLAGRQKLSKDMDAAETKFSSGYSALESDFLKKLNPAGKTFNKSFMDHSGKLTKQKLKIIGELHEVEAAARKAIDTLKAGAPERPKTGPPVH